MATPKVSIIMPSLNVGPFIRECIESAVNQTLKEIEIICVDAGSTDGTLEVLQEYADKDSRVQLIHSDVKSYGYQMNLGLDSATGEYIGILETDDWAEPHMFETLWKAAKEHRADVVQSNFYQYTTKNGIQNVPFENLAGCTYDTVFRPIDNTRIFFVWPAIWSSIYSREMLMSNHIRFNETPGASFQDTSFFFQVLATSQRAFLLRDHFLHYRSDNDGSSVHSKGKIFSIADEMHFFESFLDANPSTKEQLLPLFVSLKYGKYRWNLDRLDASAGYSFLPLMHEELSAAFDAGLLHEEVFPSYAWSAVLKLIENPANYFRALQRARFEREAVGTSAASVILKEPGCTDPQISVVLPFFNAESHLEKCLTSVLCQSFRNIEILCVDDGSTDSSRKIVEQYAAADNRIALIDMLVNAGPSAARNAAIRIARGKYIYCLDSDVSILPDALDKLYSCAETWQLDVLHFGAENLPEDSRAASCAPASGDVLLWDQLQGGSFRHNAFLQLIQKNFLEEVQLHFREEALCSDVLLTCVPMARAKRALCIEDSFCIQQEKSAAAMSTKQLIRQCTDLCIASALLSKTATTDQTFGDTAKTALSFCARKALEDAKLICQKLSAANQEKIADMLPAEYRFFYTQMLLENRNVGAKKETFAARSSLSHRIRSAVTFILRKVRSVFRSVKKNGLPHTFRLIVARFKR